MQGGVDRLADWLMGAGRLYVGVGLKDPRCATWTPEPDSDCQAQSLCSPHHMALLRPPTDPLGLPLECQPSVADVEQLSAVGAIRTHGPDSPGPTLV